MLFISHFQASEVQSENSDAADIQVHLSSSKLSPAGATEENSGSRRSASESEASELPPALPNDNPKAHIKCNKEL